MSKDQNPFVAEDSNIMLDEFVLEVERRYAQLRASRFGPRVSTSKAIGLKIAIALVAQDYLPFSDEGRQLLKEIRAAKL